MTGYRVHFINEIERPRAYNTGGTKWIVFNIVSKGHADHQIDLFFETEEAFDQAIITLNAEIRESVQ